MPTSPPRLRLIHWQPAEAEGRVRRLSELGYAVDYDARSGPELLAQLTGDPPTAVVIDLARLPSHGRDVAVVLRQRKSTRLVPLVFVGGEREKVERLRTLLPDAEYADWLGIQAAIARALAAPPGKPVVPSSSLAGYSGTPLPKKLGIRAGSRVALIAAPEEFEATLGELPERAVLRRGWRGHADIVLWFVERRARFEREIGKLAERVDGEGLWICWPKKSSGVATDINEPLVRALGLAHGLVDYKICAVDAVWSALKFARRR